MTALRSAIRRLLDDSDLEAFHAHRFEPVDGHLVEVDTFDIPRT